MSHVVIGVDVGTTRVKAVAVDPAGAVCGESERPTPWRPSGEVDPAALVQLAQMVAVDAADTCTGAVAALGVTGMAETGVLVDGHDRPLAPAIAWHDPRGDLDTIGRELGADAFRRTTGLPFTVLPSLAKLLWLRANRPDTGAARRFYSVGEWVVRQLGGAPVAELSLASRTGLLELTTGRPWDAAADLLGWPSLLPDRVVAGTPAGKIAGEDTAPVLRGATLTVAGHDHQVAAYAVGAAVDGALFDSLGTAEALVRTVRPPVEQDAVDRLTGSGMSVGWGVVADHLCVLAGLTTGRALNRLAVLLGATTNEDRLALGERAVGEQPHPTLRLVDVRPGEFGIAGVSDGVTPAQLWRTAVDALVDVSARALAQIDALTGAHDDVVVAGGWLRNAALLAAKRRQFPRMRTTGVAEPGAYGAALLAASAAGVHVERGTRP